MRRTSVVLACAFLLTCAASAGARAAGAQATDPLSPRLPPQGDTLTLADAQRRALEQNPSFLASHQEREIARGRLRQARVYPFNPELELRTPALASGGVRGGGTFGEYELFLSQEVEWAGQRGLRTRAARLDVERVDAFVRDAARQMLAAVSEAFYTALAAERRADLAREIHELNRRLVDAVRTQARAGETSRLEANLAEIELGRARARVLAVEREAASARLELQRLTGLGATATARLEEPPPVTLAPAALDPDSLLAQALARRPDLVEHARAAEQARALIRLAQREAVPNLRLGALVERGEAGGEPRLGIGVSLPVPLWNRNQGTIAERHAEAEQATYARQATALAVRTEVLGAYRAYVAAHEQAEVFERDVLQPARTNQALLETAYRAGRLDLPALLLLRNQLLDAELGYWDAWLAKRRALTALEAATGWVGGDRENFIVEEGHHEE